MDLSRLKELEERLHQAKQFSDVWDFFFTHFGESPEFMSLGEKGGDEFLEAVLQEVGKELFGRPVAATRPRFVRLPEHGFIHGTVLLDGRLTSAFYFEKLHKGMLAVVWSGETKLIRFTGRALYEALHRSEN